jgi:uncharacterized membrane protein HdeD (DUF308 family)
MPLVASALLSALAENWWLLLLRGLVAIAFGVVAFFWPDITLVALTYLFGIYAIVDGVVAIWAAFNALGGAGPRWWLGLTGVVSILAGLAAFFYTGITTQVLLAIIAVWAIIIGIVQIWGAMELRRILDDTWLLGLAGALAIAFGVIMIAKPGAGDCQAWRRRACAGLDDWLVRDCVRRPLHCARIPIEEIQANLNSLRHAGEGLLFRRGRSRDDRVKAPQERV